MAEAFQAAVGEDGEMDAYELMTVLNETGFISGMFRLGLWNKTHLMQMFFKEKPLNILFILHVIVFIILETHSNDQ